MAAMLPRVTASPAPVFRRVNQIGSHWIALDIAQDGEKMAIVLDGKALESSLVKMSVSHRIVSMFPSLGVGQCQPAEKAGQFTVSFRPEDHVPMVGHHDPVEDANGRPFMGQRQNLLERQEILILLEQPQAAIGAVQDVIDDSAGGNACNAWHEESIMAKGEM